MAKKAYHKPAVRSEDAFIGVYGGGYGGKTLGPTCATLGTQICTPETNCEWQFF